MKPTLYILCGIPGCGKSSFAQNFITRNKVWVSRDFFRFHLVKENEEYFSKEKEVFKMFSETIAMYLKNGTSVIADATHLTYFSRKKTIDAVDKIFKDYQIIYVVFDTPLELALERNAMRQGREKVPEEAIKNMNDSFTIPYQEDPRTVEIWTIKNGDI